MATGLTLSGRYELRTRLGSGGAGAVWRAFDLTLQREVAIKLIALDGPGLGVDIEGPISRFRREARAVAALNHPNIVAAYDFGVHDDVAFLVMELVEGASLAEHLRRRRQAGLGGFDEGQVIHLARQVCAGLAVAHRARLVHRDMKPSNLMVADADGRVKIVDFGIARIEEQSRLTRTGSYLGTLPYVAPEQMDAEPIDGRADLYSLACVLFELMTCRSPYDAKSPMQWMSAHQKGTPFALRRFAPAASADMEALLLRMMSKNPTYRPPDADAVSEALAQIGTRLTLRGSAPVRTGGYGPPRGVAVAPRPPADPAPVTSSPPVVPVSGGADLPRRAPGARLADSAPDEVAAVFSTGDIVALTDADPADGDAVAVVIPAPAPPRDDDQPETPPPAGRVDAAVEPARNGFQAAAAFPRTTTVPRDGSAGGYFTPRSAPVGDTGSESRPPENDGSEPAAAAVSAPPADVAPDPSGGSAESGSDESSGSPSNGAERPRPRPTGGHTRTDEPSDRDVASDVSGPTVPLLRSKGYPSPTVPRQGGPHGQPGTARHARPSAPMPPVVPIAPTMRRGSRPTGGTPYPANGVPVVTGGARTPSRRRRIGQNVAIVAVVLAAIVLIATVVAALGHPRRGRDVPAPPSSPPVAPAVGQCYPSGWASAIDRDEASVWSAADGSAPIGCTTTHSFEVVALASLTGVAGNADAPPVATSAAVRDAYAGCAEKADEYLGGPWRGAYAWLGVAVPDAATWQRGARWVSCVLRPTANWQGVGVSSIGTLRDGLRGARPAAITCFSSKAGRPTDCDAPHTDEVVGLSVLPAAKWPGTSGRTGTDKLYGDACEIVAAHFLGFATTKAWTSPALGWAWWSPTEEQWNLGNRTAVCTVNTDRPGGMVGSVRGLRNGTPRS